MRHLLYKLQEKVADHTPWMQYPRVARISAARKTDDTWLDTLLKLIIAAVAFWVLFAPVLAALAFFLLPILFGTKA